jgi:hypothetical protein
VLKYFWVRAVKAKKVTDGNVGVKMETQASRLRKTANAQKACKHGQMSLFKYMAVVEICGFPQASRLTGEPVNHP